MEHFFNGKNMHEVFNSGWFNWNETNWVENFRCNNRDDVMMDDDCLVMQPSCCRTICGCYHVMWWMSVSRNGEEIIAVCGQDNDAQLARTIAFTNSENFWTYFMLKHR